MSCWLWINFDQASHCCILSARQTFGQIGNDTRHTANFSGSFTFTPSPGNKVNNIAICYSVYISYICTLGGFPIRQIAASRARCEHNNCLLQIEKDKNNNNKNNNGCTALGSLFVLLLLTTFSWQQQRRQQQQLEQQQQQQADKRSTTVTSPSFILFYWHFVLQLSAECFSFLYFSLDFPLLCSSLLFSHSFSLFFSPAFLSSLLFLF